MFYQWLLDNQQPDDKIAVKDECQEISYQKLDHDVAAIADFLCEEKVRKGDRVIIINHNDIDTVEAILACVRNGYIFVIVHEKTEQRQFDYFMQDASPAYVLGADPEETPWKTYAQIRETAAEEGTMHTRNIIDWEENGYILYTSGSTSTPKGVLAGYKQIAFCTEAINERIGNRETDRILCCLPLSFDYGLYQIFLCLKYGAVLVLRNHYRIQSLPRILQNEKITGFPAVPSLLSLLIRSRLLKKLSLPDLRYITSTGDHLSVPCIQECEILFPHTAIIPMYGLTECKRVSIMPPGRQDKILAGSCGKPLSGTQIWLENKDCGTEVGELIVAGRNVMKGYWNDPQQTEKVFSVDPATGERILKTGDLFRIDQDGFLYFVGRQKRIIKSNGYRISGMELESRLSEIKTIQEIRVFGYPDEVIGEKIAACIFSRDPDIQDKLRRVCSQWPDHWRIHTLNIQNNPLPKNANGKIDENELRRQLNL